MFDVDALAQMMAGLIVEHVGKALAPLDERLVAVEGRSLKQGEKGEAGENGADGISPDPEDIAAAFVPAAQELIAIEVAKAVSQLPPAERGEKGEAGEDGKQGEAGRDGVNGNDGRDGKDAAGIVQALKDSGELVLTLQDGRLIRTGIRDGEKGQDGKDGLGFDDMDACVLDDDRTIELSFRRGDEEKAFTFKWPTLIYRGIWVEGVTYQAGDVVTWGGSAHVAETETTTKPDTKECGWRLAVKRGRNGGTGRTTRGEE